MQQATTALRPDATTRKAMFAGAFGALVAVAGAALVMQAVAPRQVKITQEVIDAAVAHTLQETVLPSPAVKAYETILPSLVRVNGFVIDPKTKEESQHGVGTGVVIVDNGTILTNLHVVSGADKIVVTFFDGTESVAHVTGMRPEHDLAVIRARRSFPMTCSQPLWPAPRNCRPAIMCLR